MKLEEAIQELRDGNYVKRKGWNDWIGLHSNFSTLKVEDVIADDWETQKKPFYVSKTVCYDNIVRMGILSDVFGIPKSSPEKVFNIVVREVKDSK